MKETSKFLWVSCKCHVDKTPSVCINKVEHNGKPVGYYFCYSCGKFGQVDVEKVKKMSKKKSICRPKRAIDWNKLVKTYIGEMNEIIDEINEYAWVHLSKELNVKPMTLNHYFVGWDTEAFAVPMHDEEKNIIGIHRRFPDGKKCCVNGSRLGLFIPDVKHPQVVVTEGFSDSAVATECGCFGLGMPSASFGEKLIRRFLENHLTNKDVYVTILLDNDEAGIKGRNKLRAELLRCGFYKFRIPYISPYKDLKEYYLSEGKEKTKKLLGV